MKPLLFTLLGLMVLASSPFVTSGVLRIEDIIEHSKLCVATNDQIEIISSLDEAPSEDTKEPLKSRCPLGQIPCNDGACIDKTQWCDSIDDCSDESDETYCQKTRFYTGSDPNNCAKTHFLCKSGICYPSDVNCDGHKDCESGEDEDNCDVKHTTENHVTESSSWDTTHSEERTTVPHLEPTSQSTRNSFHGEGKTPRPSNGRTGVNRSHQNPSVVHKHRSPPLHFNASQIVLTLVTISKAERWLFNQRRPDWGWDKDTARALIALALANPDRFSMFNKDDSLMKKQFQVIMAIDLLGNQPQKEVSLSKLSLYINAMLATCQDPRNFHGVDLVQELRQRTTAAQARSKENGAFINPVAYLTLCNCNRTEPSDVCMLKDLLNPSTHEQKWLDMQALSVMAFSCITRNTRLGNQTLLNNAIRSIVDRMAPDGSFGNVYSSALAIQALVSAHAGNYWTTEPSLTFLKVRQLESGSFGDLLATYYALPALAGKSLTHLRNVYCNISKDDGLISLDTLKNSREVKHYVYYSLYLGKPAELSHSIMLPVPVNTTFFNIMTLAGDIDPMFRFLYEKEGDDVSVYSISNIPNDAERGIYWNLYIYPDYRTATSGGLPVVDQRPYTKGIKNLILNEGEHVVFWYHSI